MGLINPQFLLFTVLPIVGPRILAFYRSLRSKDATKIRPLPPRASLALQLLLLSALGFLLSTFPFFSPENVLQRTASKLNTPAATIFGRLEMLRPLTETDNRLRSVFETGGKDARMLYLKYGPAVLTGCRFVDHKTADAAVVLAAFAIPTVLAPHLMHLVVLGVATTVEITGREGARWRTAAVIAGLVLLAGELLAISSWDHAENAVAAKDGRMINFYWRVRLVRGLAVAAVDAVMGWVIWLAGTGRAFVAPMSGAERVELTTRDAETTLGQLRALGTMRNVVHRTPGLRSQVDRYWSHEAEVMRNVIEDKEVVVAMNNVLESTNMADLAREAEEHVNAWIPEVTITKAPPGT